MVQVACFRLWGRFAHFRRAESAVSALTYPVPPRTALIGLIGAVMGMPKDHAQIELEPLQIAVSGKYPLIHWHKAKLRKDPPALLNWTIKMSQSADRNTSPERAALIAQEWLFNPEYVVWVSLPDSYHNEFTERIKEKRWYFQPCLGLSEFMADIEYLDEMSGMTEKLPLGTYEVESVIPQKQAEIEISQVLDRQLSLTRLNMPRKVSGDRVFKHDSYIAEKDGLPVPVRTADAYRIKDRVIMFL